MMPTFTPTRLRPTTRSLTAVESGPRRRRSHSHRSRRRRHLSSPNPTIRPTTGATPTAPSSRPRASRICPLGSRPPTRSRPRPRPRCRDSRRSRSRRRRAGRHRAGRCRPRRHGRRCPTRCSGRPSSSARWRSNRVEASHSTPTSPSCATTRRWRARGGQSPREVIERYIGAEQHLRQDFLGGMIAIGQNMGYSPQQIAQAMAQRYLGQSNGQTTGGLSTALRRVPRAARPSQTPAADPALYQ